MQLVQDTLLHVALVSSPHAMHTRDSNSSHDSSLAGQERHRKILAHGSRRLREQQIQASTAAILGRLLTKSPFPNAERNGRSSSNGR